MRRWLVAGAALLSMASLSLLVTWPHSKYQHWQIIPQMNPCAVEGLAWNEGRLDLAFRAVDSAIFNDKIYNVFPPLFTMISAAVLGVVHLATGQYEFPGWIYLLILVVPLWLATYWGFRAVVDAPWKAALLGLGFLAGTPLTAQLVPCQMGWIWQVNHVLSQVGLLLVAGDCLGRRRMWPSMVGLLIASLTRSLTLFFFVPVGIIALRQRRGRACLLIAFLLATGLPMALSYLKFGSAFESGYALIYEGRNDELAKRAAHGLFALRFIPDNLYYMNLAVPHVTFENARLSVQADAYGGSLWLSTPLLLFVFATLPHWWRDPSRKLLVLGTLPIVVALLMYHNTGWRQFGHYRFGLDFLVILLAVVAPYLWGPRRTIMTCALLAWSMVYFYWATGVFAAFIKPA